jgi:hypothetical protein
MNFQLDGHCLTAAVCQRHNSIHHNDVVQTIQQPSSTPMIWLIQPASGKSLYTLTLPLQPLTHHLRWCSCFNALQ